MNVKLAAAAVSAVAITACSPDLSLQAEAPPRAAERTVEGTGDRASPAALREERTEGTATALPAADKAVETGNKGN